VGHYQIEKAVAVEIEKGTACAPACFRSGKPCGFGLVTKRAVPLVAIKDILAPLGYEEVGIAVVVIVAGADALPPTGVREPSLRGYIFELEAAQVVIEKVGGRE
jgi:hypothetical protein